MRAGIENKEMVSLLGIDIHRLFTAAFALGAYLAGIAGALTAPIRGLNPGMGVGHARHRLRGRRAGRASATCSAPSWRDCSSASRRRWSRAYWTEASTVVIFAVMAVVLLVRPQGLFGIR